MREQAQGGRHGQKLWGNAMSACRSCSSAPATAGFLPTCLSQTPSQAPSVRLPVPASGIAACWLCSFTLHTCSRAGHVSHPIHWHSQHSILSQGCIHQPTGVLVWEREQLPDGRERFCVWVNKLKPKCLNPSPVARLWYNAKICHRDSCSTFLCPQPKTWHIFYPPGAARAQAQQLHPCGTSPGTKSLSFSHYVNNSSPGAISPTTTGKAAVMFVIETPEREIFHAWSVTQQKVLTALECIGLNHCLNSIWYREMHSTPEMWCFPTFHSCVMLHLHPSFSRDA